LKSVEYFIFDKESLNFNLINSKSKIIYLIENLSFDEELTLEKELKKFFDSFEKNKKRIFLNKIYFGIKVDSKSEDVLFKKIVFVRKKIVKIVGVENSQKIKFLLKNNFSLEENQKILENKLLKINGVII
jgi:hypothetical protein